MIPIHELLNRIRWDPEFSKGDFQLGYYEVPVDVVENPVQLAPWMRQATNVAADAKRSKRK
jgi:hypothetical protein